MDRGRLLGIVRRTRRKPKENREEQTLDRPFCARHDFLLGYFYCATEMAAHNFLVVTRVVQGTV